MQKIVFFDIDGTLVGPSDVITPSALRAIHALRDKGIKTAIATGRSGWEMRDFKQNHPVELFDVLIYGNGTQIEYNGQVIYKQHIDPKEVADIVNIAREHNIPYGLTDTENWRMSVREHPLLTTFMDGVFTRMGDIYDPDFHLHNDVYAGLLLTGMENAHLFEPVLRQCEIAQGILTGGLVSNHLDFWRKDITKATSIRKATELLGIPMEQVYAIGDGFNDIHMLQEVGVGIAMGNAHPDVQKHADFVTKHIDEDGVEYAMKHLGLI